tara:strand:+ start:2705 stop:3700 length:996 start_codon:yes stop_codon:yes gene_type:complete
MRKNIPEITISGRGIKRTLNSIVMLSPLAGVSDLVFRQLIRKWAPESLLFTEMINATLLNKSETIQKFRQLSEEQGPVGVQIFDYRPWAMVDAAKRAEEAGAFLIDINMGCPAKKIAKKGGGSALLKDLLLAKQIVKDVAKAVHIPVTVKARLGWCEKTSEPVNLALELQDAGAQLLTLHGRTKSQGFSGKANWSQIASVKKELAIPIIANGDITNSTEASRCLSITGADGIMIGRASLGAPWIIGQIDASLSDKEPIKTPKGKDRVQLALDHLNNLLEFYGSQGLFIARKHMNWTCTGFTGASSLRHALIRANTAIEAINLLENQISALS